MSTQMLQAFALPLAFLAIFYMFIIRPQKKKEKEIKEMRERLKVGDVVFTIGGIVGKVVKIKDDEVTLEIGADKNKIVFKKWAVGSVDKKSTSPAAEEAESQS